MSEIVRAVIDEVTTDLPAPVKVDDEFLGGLHVEWAFPNGYGASVINHQFSYGVELGVLQGGQLTYDTPITDDVVGHIKSMDALLGLLRAIRDLPAAEGD